MSDHFEALDELVMRLYVKAGHFDQALEVCAVRLKESQQQQSTLKIAEQITAAAWGDSRRVEKLRSFLIEIEKDIPKQEPAAQHIQYL